MIKLLSYFSLLRENVNMKKDIVEMKAQIYDLKKGNQKLSNKKNHYKRKWQQGKSK